MTSKKSALLVALLTESTLSGAAKEAGISRSTAYKYLADQEFQEELNVRRSECIYDTVRYLQSKLTLCSEQLMRIIENAETADQVKINAINTVFANFKAMYEAAEVITRLENIEKAMKEVNQL